MGSTTSGPVTRDLSLWGSCLAPRQAALPAETWSEELALGQCPVQDPQWHLQMTGLLPGVWIIYVSHWCPEGLPLENWACPRGDRTSLDYRGWNQVTGLLQDPQLGQRRAGLLPVPLEISGGEKCLDSCADVSSVCVSSGGRLPGGLMSWGPTYVGRVCWLRGMIDLPFSILIISKDIRVFACGPQIDKEHRHYWLSNRTKKVAESLWQGHLLAK